MVSLPPSLQLTLSWGASALWTKQVELPCDLEIAEIGARLLGDRSACELRTATSVHPVRAERRVRTEHGDLELVIDAVTDDIAPAVPSVIDPRRAAFDLGSMVLHAGVGLMLFMLADPLEAEMTELPDQRMLLSTVELPFTFGDAIESTRVPDQEPGGHRAVDKREPGAAGPGATVRAALGEPWQPSAGGPSLASNKRGNLGIEDPNWSPMIALLAEAGASKLSNGSDAWSGAGLSSGPSWGEPGGVGDDGGVGALSLSGIGEGGGSRADGINLGPGGMGTCGLSCSGVSGGTLAGRTPRVRTTMTICGTRYVDGVKVSEHDCSTSVSGRLPAEAIQRIVRQNFGRFRFCYEKDLRAQPSLSERVTVSFTIGRDGSVSRAQGTADGGAQASTASCVAQAFRSISFPQPEGGVVNVTYPIVFTPG